MEDGTLDLSCRGQELPTQWILRVPTVLHSCCYPAQDHLLPTQLPLCSERQGRNQQRAGEGDLPAGTSGGGGQRDGPEFHPLGRPVLSGAEVDLGPMNCGQRMRLCSTCASPAQGPAERGSFLRGRTFPQEQSVACLPGMNLGVGQPGQAWRCPAAARRYQSGTFRLPHSWG